MNLHQFDIRCINAPTVLPRVALMFSRRGLPIEQLELTTSDDGQHQQLDITARCDAAAATKLEAQLRRVIEIVELTVAEATSGKQTKTLG